VTHIDGDEMDLGVAVLARLGGRHVDDLAGPPLDDDVAAAEEDQGKSVEVVFAGHGDPLLAKSRALDPGGERSSQ
jgi:hypothetical protein